MAKEEYCSSYSFSGSRTNHRSLIICSKKAGTYFTSLSEKGFVMMVSSDCPWYFGGGGRGKGNGIILTVIEKWLVIGGVGVSTCGFLKQYVLSLCLSVVTSEVGTIKL